MNSQAVAAVAVLVVLELVVLRISQQLAPRLYFTTSSFFDQRADVSGKAVFFRLSIPLAGGVISGFLAPQNALLVAGVAGGVSWFLVIWPILWNPKLINSHGFTALFLSLLTAFWLAFVALSLAGAALVEIGRDVVAGEAGEVETQYLWALVTGMSFGICTQGMNWFAGRRLTFVDDATPAKDSQRDEVDDYSDDIEDLELGLVDRVLVYWSEVFGVLSLGVCAIALVILARRRD